MPVVAHRVVGAIVRHTEVHASGAALAARSRTQKSCVASLPLGDGLEAVPLRLAWPRRGALPPMAEVAIITLGAVRATDDSAREHARAALPGAVELGADGRIRRVSGLTRLAFPRAQLRDMRQLRLLGDLAHGVPRKQNLTRLGLRRPRPDAFGDAPGRLYRPIRRVVNIPRRLAGIPDGSIPNLCAEVCPRMLRPGAARLV
mmetsp:Transcript_128641/g.251950  ORF Transcript_128641/g.251950 Transcript_128641/m.251950 type:complete len:202 (-) Transcript_128641:98-703(-)